VTACAIFIPGYITLIYEYAREDTPNKLEIEEPWIVSHRIATFQLLSLYLRTLM
jgi:hypothetical protein